jgi:hypothetical protein
MVIELQKTGDPMAPAPSSPTPPAPPERPPFKRIVVFTGLPTG